MIRFTPAQAAHWPDIEQAMARLQRRRIRTPHPLADHRLEYLDRPPTSVVWCEGCGQGWPSVPEEAVHRVRGGMDAYGGSEDESWLVCPVCYLSDSLVQAPRWRYRGRRRRVGLLDLPGAPETATRETKDGA